MKCPSQLNSFKHEIEERLFIISLKRLQVGTLYFILHISDNVVINREL